MITFVHTADIHFGMENYGKVDPRTGIHTRLLDFYHAFNFCIDTAIEQNVDFFLFSGDAYKTHHPTQTQQKLLFRSLLRLYKANIPVVIVVGNHDNPLSFGKTHALDIFNELPVSGFHVITKPTALTLSTKSGPINIVGIPWPTRNNVSLSHEHITSSTTAISSYIEKAVGSIIYSLAQSLDPNIPAVLAGHLTVSSGIFSGSEKRAIYGTDPVLLPSQLTISPFDYIALGHLHRFQDLNPSGHPPLVYSGSIERIDFGERKDEKGFCLVKIKQKGQTHYDFIKVPIRPFIQIDAKLESGASLTQTQQLINIIEKHAIKDAVLKILYYVPAGKQDMVDIPVIQRTCSEAIHLTGIIPIIPASIRERRVGTFKAEMSPQELLELYFACKPELKERQSSLLEKIVLLMHEKDEPADH